MIKEFFINGLYGEKNVLIPFNNPYKVIVAENGYGKTTILNAFHALVKGEFSKLRRIHFNEIGLSFENNKKIVFKKSEFEAEILHLKEHPLFDHLESRLGIDFLMDLVSDVRKLPSHRIEHSYLFHKAMAQMDIPSRILRDFLRETTRGNRNNKKISSEAQKKHKELNEAFSFETLYLPTYRRVEEDIKILSGNEETLDSNYSINFGMSDVEERIDEITLEILNSSVEWFSKINGQMLSQLVSGFSVSDSMRESISSPKAVRIVLERIGSNISEAHKQQILDLVESEEIFNGNHEPLVYFVANLLKVYEQQQDNDDAIQAFTSVCNKYLNDKEVVYDESRVTIEIIRKKHGQTVPLESLSSGEKQILALFALLYLGKKRNLAIFFDEPELSLSMEWQKNLLPDIVNSGKCGFLFCTTHSPFIFENELLENTTDLAMYVKDVE